MPRQGCVAALLLSVKLAASLLTHDVERKNLPHPVDCLESRDRCALVAAKGAR